MFYAVIQPTYGGKYPIIKQEESRTLDALCKDPKNTLDLLIRDAEGPEVYKKHIYNMVENYIPNEKTMTVNAIFSTEPRSAVLEATKEIYSSKPYYCYVDFLSYILYHTTEGTIQYIYDDEECKFAGLEEQYDPTGKIQGEFVKSGYCGLSVA